MAIPTLANYSLPNPAGYYDVGALDREVGNTAAAKAVGLGIPGSPFARNLGTALRFSEQQRFLQPYLEREHSSAMQAAQIATQAAQERNAMERLRAQLEAQAQQNQLERQASQMQLAQQLAGQMALARFNQTGEMQQLQARLDAQRFSDLLPFFLKQQEARRERIGMPWVGPKSIPAGVSSSGGTMRSSGGDPFLTGGVTRPNFAPVIGQSAPVSRAQTMQNAVNQILQQAGIPTSGTSSGIPDYSRFTPPNVFVNTPQGGDFEWGSRPSAENATALQQYYDTPAYGEFEWLAGTSPEVAQLQEYYS